jgi:hypothetical protein
MPAIAIPLPLNLPSLLLIVTSETMPRINPANDVTIKGRIPEIPRTSDPTAMPLVFARVDFLSMGIGGGLTLTASKGISHPAHFGAKSSLSFPHLVHLFMAI